MDCRIAIAMLERRFDEGGGGRPELDRHLAGCALCRAKADELESLGRMLYALPFEAPAGIEDRVKAVIIQERSRRNPPAVIGVVAACALIGASGLNRLFPLREFEEKVWDYVLAWIPNTEWLGSGRSYREQFEMAWSKGQGIIEGVGWFSAPVIWSALATAVVLLLVLNGVYTAQLRQTGR